MEIVRSTVHVEARSAEAAMNAAKIIQEDWGIRTHRPRTVVPLKAMQADNKPGTWFVLIEERPVAKVTR